ncbi:MAG TPA: glycosyltransferase family 2 protein [Anaerolineaceae bacterium]|jgi:polyisoprenyl-phosphate glycosyltransferase
MKPTFTVIAPIFNESECLPELYRRIKMIFEKTGDEWEFILVDDGSQDGSTDIIREMAQEDSHVRPVIFARNFGHQIAVTAGMDYSRGDAVIVIDADLQDPPEVILELIAKWREGYQVVYAVRIEREGETWFKKMTASLFYRTIYRITEVKIPMDSGDFRLLDRRVVKVMNSMRERHRFLRGMSSWAGFRQIGVPYRRVARFAGSTKYPLRKMLHLAENAVTGFSYFPLQVASYVGFISAVISIILIPIIIFLRLFTLHQELAGQATTLVAVMLFSGVQLICLGIMGEYIGRIYDEVKGRPLYTVSQDPADFEHENPAA